MKIKLRQQLALLLVLSGAIGLAVLAVATWIVNYDFVLNVSSSRLEITASLKAAQIAYNLELMQIAATFIAARSSIQNALVRYNNGFNTSAENWASATSHLQDTLSNAGLISSALVLQCQVFAANPDGPNGTRSVMNVTGPDFDSITLPWLDGDGKQSYLGEPNTGYPAALYPNLTIGEDGHANYDGVELDLYSTLVLGPTSINSSFALLSMTVPVINNNSTESLVGWITVVTNAKLIREVFQDERGLGDSGQTLLIGPSNANNLFAPGIIGNESRAASAEVHYVLPLNITAESRHPLHVAGAPNRDFTADDFPAVRHAIIENVRGVNDVGSLIKTHNEAGKKVSVGYSTAPTILVDWVIVVEQARNEVWKPIDRLREIILACLFGVIGFMCIVSFPLAHWAVLPIVRMQAASAQTIVPRGGSFSGSSDSLGEKDDSTEGDPELADHRNKGFITTCVEKAKAKRRAYYHVERRPETRGRIPGKVPLRKQQWIKDEMYDLVVTFNEMSDELVSQYTKLEDRVQQRTVELEQSMKAAEAANESKTLFVAMCSHELRTPLNGILGMTAVCMEEEDPVQLKHSLNTIYKSGDLLLRTLTDLLNFSSNQLGSGALTLDEKEFPVRDLETQTIAIFGEQAKGNWVDLRVIFEESSGDSYGNGTFKDMTLYADIHRILQVIINLVSNSLKFTPPGGSVTLTIKCLTEPPTRNGSLLKGRRIAEKGTSTPLENATANFINPRELFDVQLAAHPQAKSPPPGRDMVMQLEVRDTGPGVEEEMLHRIFEPFVQADAGLSRKHSGTGLGLSISSQLVSLMGGTIGVQSTVGKGSIFTVKLPMRLVHGCDTPRSSFSRPISRIPSTARMPTIPNGRTPSSELTLVGMSDSIDFQVASPSEASPSESAPKSSESVPKSSEPPQRPVVVTRRVSKTSPQDFSKARVLVAEDNKVNQEVILRMLKLEKILNVTIAADGKEALDLVKNREGDFHTYDIIFMDIQMPNMDGHCATKLIRESGYKKPIVALTAFADQSNIDECYGSGMDYFLSKPIKRPLLKKVLSEYCLPAASEEGNKEAETQDAARNQRDGKNPEDIIAGTEKAGQS